MSFQIIDLLEKELCFIPQEQVLLTNQQNKFRVLALEIIGSLRISEYTTI